MTNEQKQLLIKDLSARLSHRVRCFIRDDYDVSRDGTLYEMDLDDETCGFKDTGIEEGYWYTNVDNVKPYLRPMNTMTEDEAVEYFRLQTNNPYADVTGFKIDKTTLCLEAYVDNVYKWYCWGEVSNIKTFDWLNKYHFDYRGLIYDELALNAPTGMYEF